MSVQQSSGRAILDWNTFNIGSQAAVSFQQPGPTSVVLNRVGAGGGVSEIYGTLTANGQLFLVNPAGTLFGRGAQVNVGGLVASTLDISNENFLRGNYKFASNGAAGSIVNEGLLQASVGGYVALLSPQVRNDGVIAAQLGSVVLGAGKEITLDIGGTGLISMRVEQSSLDALIENRGLVQAEGGVVYMGARAAGQVTGGVVNNSGLIQATRFTERDGVIRLEASDVSNSGAIVANGTEGGGVTIEAVDTAINSGTISAIGIVGKGGEIRLLGNKVGLFGAGSLDVSGVAGGGNALVGGNFQGKGPEQNASMTYVAPGALIRADAGVNGDGGKVIVWSDDSTVFAGTLSAKGGAGSGSGGFVEISGKRALEFSPSRIDLTAANGGVGSLLLDPLNIIVATGGGAAYADVSTFAAQAGTTQTIDPATLNAVGASVNLQATNDITVNNAINLTTAGAGLAARAGNNVNVNASITTNNGAITLSARDPGGTQTAGGTLVLGAALNSGGGNISLTNNGGSNPISLTAAVTAGAGSVTFSNPTVVSGSRVVSGDGGVTFSSTLNGSGSVTVDSTSNTAFNGAVGNSVALSSLFTNSGGTTVISGGSVTTTGAQAYGDNVTLGAGTTLTSSGGGNIGFSGTVNGASALTVNAGSGAVTFGANVGGITALASLNVTSPAAVTRDVTTNGNITFNGNATFNSTLTTNGGNFVVTGTTTAGNLGNNALVINAGSGNVTLSGAVNGTTSGGQSLSILSSGTTTLGSTVGGTIALASFSTDSGGTTSLAGGVTVAGAAGSTTTQLITIGDPASATGNVSLNSANGGAITLNDFTFASPLTLGISTTGSVIFSGTGSMGSAGNPVSFTVTPTNVQTLNPISLVFSSPSTPSSLIFAPGTSVSAFLGGSGSLTTLAANASPILANTTVSQTELAAVTVGISAPDSSTSSGTVTGAAVSVSALAGALGPAPAPVTAGTSTEAGTTRLTTSSGLSREAIRQIDQQIAQARTQLFSPALNQLVRDPTVADVPECSSGAQFGCVQPAKDKAAPSVSDAQPVIKRRVALLVGNSRYLAPIPTLQTPVRDVEDIGQVLKDRLGYETRVVRNATRMEIVEELNSLVRSLDADDSVFVYYAGHGYQGEKGGGGYWIPVDATNNDASTWISNASISKFLANMASRQVILVSDSCYSGTLTQEQKVRTSDATVFDRNEILRKRSVLVMSSGGNEPVADGGHDNHSLFAYHLLRALNSIEGDLVGGDIHDRVRTAILREYPQDPQYGAVVSAGHTAGGEYLIERK